MMSSKRQDNCLFGSPPPIRLPGDLPLRDESSQTLGRSLSGSVNATNVQVPARVRASRRAMQFFVPRPFPPPALANVPVEYIIDQLHTLAPHYWSKPETADCTIIVPLDGLLRKTGQASRSSVPYVPAFPVPMSKNDQFGRMAEPTLRPAPRMVMKVHLDYLSAHSTLLRGLFSGVSPLELIDSNSSSLHSTPRGSSYHLPLRSESSSPSPLPSAARGLPIAPLYPRLLPSSPSHPTVYLPVPDPSSFRLLVHYMYFGATTYIEDALDTGAVTWEGLARNVEFLGMDTDIKLCLGRWYSRWQRGRGERSYHAEDFDDDYTDSEDDSFFESDDDELEESSVTSASADEEEDQMDIDECFKHVKIDAPLNRGRQRTPRRLGHAISDPGPIRGGMPRRMPHVSQSSSPSSRGMSE